MKETKVETEYTKIYSKKKKKGIHVTVPVLHAPDVKLKPVEHDVCLSLVKKLALFWSGLPCRFTKQNILCEALFAFKRLETCSSCLILYQFGLFIHQKYIP